MMPSAMSGTNVEENRRQHRLVTGREVCERCWRPSAGCYCAHLRPIDTKTRLVLLQHPRERYVAIGTARMANLCLTHSELHVGIDWSRSAPLARALADRERPPILLYPGEGAIDITKDPPSGPVTLVVVDGTWSQTKKVVRTNPLLAALPRYAFVPPRPSEYRIRKEPDEASVATIEALVHALTALEGDGMCFSALLAPFRAMIDFQLECQDRFHGTRTRHAKRRERVRRMRVPRVFSERLDDVVCVAGEANSWPYARRASSEAHADELVQWAAYRPATGETFSCVVAPRGELAPGTSLHTGLDEATLRSGGTLEALHASWRAFVRDTDVICAWGHYETNLFLASGGVFPAGRLDLRHVARDIARGRVGSLSEYKGNVVPGDGSSLVVGRAGRKLRAIADIIASFTELQLQAGA
jgi:DTW domain-containing protein